MNDDNSLTWFAILGLLLVLVSMCFGCMSVTIRAEQGATVTVTQQKPVTTTTDATVPVMP